MIPSASGSTDQTALFGGYSALVVGASGGIGREVARFLSARGAELRVHGRHAGRTEAVAAELCGCGGRATAVVCPIDPRQPIEQAVETLLGQQIPDIVVVSYGPFLEQPLYRTGAAQWRELYEANLMLPVLIGQRCLPTMVERGFGRVLVFGGSGTAQIRGYRSVAAYSAVKTALMSWVKSAAREVAGGNVGVTALCPGYVDTEYLDDAARARYARRLPEGRLWTPRQVASAAVAVLDPRSALFNGAVIAVDGATVG